MVGIGWTDRVSPKKYSSALTGENPECLSKQSESVHDVGTVAAEDAPKHKGQILATTKPSIFPNRPLVSCSLGSDIPSYTIIYLPSYLLCSSIHPPPATVTPGSSQSPLRSIHLTLQVAQTHPGRPGGWERQQRNPPPQRHETWRTSVETPGESPLA